MQRITRSRFPGATRKRGCSLLASIALAGLAGCHTRGPSHVYFWTPGEPAAVCDCDAEQGVSQRVLGRVAAGERVVGLAYDFNTDFICLRLEPGGRIRIFKRGENRFVREWRLPAELALPAVAPQAAADLAVRPGDRHLFALHPARAEVWEFTMEGKLIRRIGLAPSGIPLGGLAFDIAGGRLVALLATTPAQVIEIDDNGAWRAVAALAAEVVPCSLGCDGDAGEYSVPLAAGGVGVFDRRGTLLCRLPASGHATAVDAGPRALIRVF